MQTETPYPSAAAINIRNELQPGDLGSVVYLHGILYAQEYGFDHTFEPYVAIPLGEFVKTATQRERIWIVEREQQVRGSAAVVKYSEKEAQLRWLLIHPAERGLGLGKQLVEQIIAFAGNAGYRSLFLWTVKGLEAATAIYRSHGFTLTESTTHFIWGAMRTEEKYVLEPLQ